MSDVPAIHELAGHPDIAATTLTIPHPYSKQDAADFVTSTRRAMEAGEGFVFAVTPKENENRLLGAVGLDIHKEHWHGELGYWMGVPYWGRGYTTEAARRILAFAFDQLELNRVIARHFVHNIPSGRVMEKIGMTYEGTLRRHYLRWGEFRDVAIYGILRLEFMPNQNGHENP